MSQEAITFGYENADGQVVSAKPVLPEASRWHGGTAGVTFMAIRPNPFLGMDVIYVMPDGMLRAGKVVNPNCSQDGHCNLTVFLDMIGDSYSNAELIGYGARNIGGGCIAVSDAGYSGSRKLGTWHVLSV